MADKNIQMTQRNSANTGWDNIYPLTKAANVTATNGKNAETYMTADAAKFKSGTGTFTAGATQRTFTEAFCTTGAEVRISITGAPQGVWTVVGNAGSFTITSDANETANVTFNYFITKAVG